MPQAPTWLPYTIRSRIDQMRINFALRGLGHTPPIPFASAEEADAELFMLLCKRDLRLGVLCFKSLLRVAGDVKLCATILSDGSLGDEDRAWVDRHLPNARWQGQGMDNGDLSSRLKSYPNLFDLYDRGQYKPIAKLVHPMLAGRCDRVVLLDADEAFFDPPERLLAFGRGDDARPLYLHDHQNEIRGASQETREAFKVLAGAMATGDRQWSLQHYFFNSGLLAYRREQLDLGAAERYLAWRPRMPPQFKTGKLAIWFGDWTPEQTAYLVMFALTNPPAEPLGDEYHLGGAPGHVFNHFLRHYIVRPGVLARLRSLVARL